MRKSKGRARVRVCRCHAAFLGLRTACRRSGVSLRAAPSSTAPAQCTAPASGHGNCPKSSAKASRSPTSRAWVRISQPVSARMVSSRASTAAEGARRPTSISAWAPRRRASHSATARPMPRSPPVTRYPASARSGLAGTGSVGRAPGQRTTRITWRTPSHSFSSGSAPSRTSCVRGVVPSQSTRHSPSSGCSRASDRTRPQRLAYRRAAVVTSTRRQLQRLVSRSCARSRNWPARRDCWAAWSVSSSSGPRGWSGWTPIHSNTPCSWAAAKRAAGTAGTGTAGKRRAAAQELAPPPPSTQTGIRGRCCWPSVFVSSSPSCGRHSMQ
mmetsp:Transcript_52956/g.94469  ORF Transcript_52956/g.94469 Transcript_52956/m.94469 type:complete len:326 (-) Transcript_52956:2872-3849(-)